MRAGRPLALFLALAAAMPAAAAVVGSLAGRVTDERGVPQIGATVVLLASDGRTLRRLYTNDGGNFQVDNLFPGLYGIRVMVPSFLPALKERILVEPGVRQFLAVQLAQLFASVELVYPAGGKLRDMTEDWKWVLRTASATRPVLRFTTPWEDRERQSVLRKFAGAFGEFQGLVQLNAGDGGRVSGLGTESDLGTAFAVATSLFGNSNLLVSGNLGYGAARGVPSAGFHTSYSREMAYGAQPEVSLTVRQLFGPVLAGRALFGPVHSIAPVLQAFTFGYQDRVALGDLMQLEYGFSYDSISFLDRLNYFSPFGKLSYQLDEETQVVLRYSGGTPRLEAAAGGEGSLGRNLTALGLYPRLSLRGGRPALQQGEHLEIGLQQKVGAGEVEIAAYRDHLTNTAVTALLPAGLYDRGDALPDLFAETSTLNAGTQENTGYRVSYSRKINEHVRAALAYGLAGVLEAQRDMVLTNDAGELRAMLRPVREQSVTAQLTAQVPQSHTWIASAYQWGSRRAVTAPDLYNVSGARSLPGLTVSLRQPLPLPQTTYLPGKFEATAEFRNLLADGYVPIRTADGRRLYLIQSARSFRGGVSFVF